MRQCGGGGDTFESKDLIWSCYAGIGDHNIAAPGRRVRNSELEHVQLILPRCCIAFYELDIPTVISMAMSEKKRDPVHEYVHLLA